MDHPEANGPADATATSIDDGGAQPTTAPTGHPAAAPRSDGGGQTWAAGLQGEENRATVNAKQWATPDDAVTAYRNLEAHATGSLRVPDADTPDDTWEAFYDALGRPETPSEYEFEKPADLPSDFPYDSAVAAEFQTIAHRHGLSPRQAQGLHDDWLKMQAGALQDGVNQSVQRMEQAHAELVKSWGDPDTPAFKQNVAYADRAIANNGGAAFRKELREIGALGPGGEVMAPRMAEMLAAVGRALYSEDHYASGQGGLAANPFVKGKENITEQGQLLRDDRARALSFIKAAGRKSEFQHLFE